MQATYGYNLLVKDPQLKQYEVAVSIMVDLLAKEIK